MTAEGYGHGSPRNDDDLEQDLDTQESMGNERCVGDGHLDEDDAYPKALESNESIDVGGGHHRTCDRNRDYDDICDGHRQRLHPLHCDNEGDGPCYFH